MSRAATTPIRGVIFDVDGTLVTTRSGRTFRQSADDWMWIAPHHQLTLWGRHRFQWSVALATNQGGVAFGYFSETEMRRALEDCGRQLGAIHVAICFTHPKATIAHYRQEADPRRKPAPAMIIECLDAMQLSPHACLVIGDRKEDEDAAKAAHCPYLFAMHFFGRLRLWHAFLEPVCVALEQQHVQVSLQALDAELRSVQLVGADSTGRTFIRTYQLGQFPPIEEADTWAQQAIQQLVQKLLPPQK